MATRRAIWAVSCVAFLSALIAPGASAEGGDRLPSESARLRQRVRLRCPPGSEGPCRGRLVGRLLGSDEDRLTLDVGLREPVVVERRHVAELDVSRGRQTGRGAGQGALIGGTVLGLVSLAFMALWDGADDSDSGLDASDYVFVTAMGAGAGALGGAVTGAIVGTAFEKWEPAPAPPVRLSLTPRPKGVALAFSFRL